MFGHIQANITTLTEEEKIRYEAVYCGLCKDLGKFHGRLSRVFLNHDFVFLGLLLSSLYEPEEHCETCRCLMQSCKSRSCVRNSCTQYASDMTIALTYHKCMDDWNDDRSRLKRQAAKYLLPRYSRVRQKWPDQCQSMERCLKLLADMEEQDDRDLDTAANCFGVLMGSVFVMKEDRWEQELYTIGEGVGRFIYIADAAIDYEQDRKKNRYNPLTSLDGMPKDLTAIMKMLLGDASKALESLPLVQDIGILRNILYSGIWIKYNQMLQEKGREIRHA